jgi:hypothetical protein
MDVKIGGRVKTSKCSPKHRDNGGSCFTLEALMKIKDSYNSKHPGNKIVIPVEMNGLNNKEKRDFLWNLIQSHLAKKCGDDETCWLNQPFLKNNENTHLALEEFFKPLAPLGQYQWLTTDDIHKVMSQYEDDNFKFSGALPIDFMNLTDSDSQYLQDLNLNTAKKYNKIGIVFNLDPHDKAGSHWIAMMIHLDLNEIWFFDSYGNKHPEENKYKLSFTDSMGNTHSGDTKIPMPTEIQEFLSEKLNKKGKKRFVLKVNTIQHQFANSECGIYSMMFLVKALKMSFEKITQEIVIDEVANQWRKEFFRR